LIDRGQVHHHCVAVTEHKHAKTVYVKEASILPAIDDWLAGLSPTSAVCKRSLS
jgi:hypothetical protein